MQSRRGLRSAAIDEPTSALDPTMVVVDLSIACSEQSGRLQLAFETEDMPADPLQAPERDDGLAIAIVRGTAATLDVRRENGRRRVEMTVRTS